MFVCWFVRFLSATRHLSTLRRWLRVAESSQAVAARAAPRERASACTARARAHAVQLLNEKSYADAFQKQNRTRARMLSYYSLPSLGVFTFRIVLNRTSSLVGADLGQLVYIYICTCHTCTHTRMQPPPHPPHARTHAHTHARTRTRARTYTHARSHARMHTRMDACTHAHKRTHARTHTHTHIDVCARTVALC